MRARTRTSGTRRDDACPAKRQPGKTGALAWRSRELNPVPERVGERARVVNAGRARSSVERVFEVGAGGAFAGAGAADGARLVASSFGWRRGVQRFAVGRVRVERAVVARSGRITRSARSGLHGRRRCRQSGGWTAAHGLGVWLGAARLIVGSGHEREAAAAPAIPTNCAARERSLGRLLVTAARPRARLRGSEKRSAAPRNSGVVRIATPLAAALARGSSSGLSAGSVTSAGSCAGGAGLPTRVTAIRGAARSTRAADKPGKSEASKPGGRRSTQPPSGALVMSVLTPRASSHSASAQPRVAHVGEALVAIGAAAVDQLARVPAR